MSVPTGNLRGFSSSKPKKNCAVKERTSLKTAEPCGLVIWWDGNVVSVVYDFGLAKESVYLHS